MDKGSTFADSRGLLRRGQQLFIEIDGSTHEPPRDFDESPALYINLRIN
jgi:hypothetical protein